MIPFDCSEQVGNETELYSVAVRHYFRARRIWQDLLDRRILRATTLIMQMRARQLPPSQQHVDAVSLILWRLMWERVDAFRIRRDGSTAHEPPIGIALWLASRPLSVDNQTQPSAIKHFDRALVNSYASCRELATWMSRRSVEIPQLPALLMLFTTSYLGWTVA